MRAARRSLARTRPDPSTPSALTLETRRLVEGRAIDLDDDMDGARGRHGDEAHRQPACPQRGRQQPIDGGHGDRRRRSGLRSHEARSRPQLDVRSARPHLDPVEPPVTRRRAVIRGPIVERALGEHALDGSLGCGRANGGSSSGGLRNGLQPDDPVTLTLSLSLPLVGRSGVDHLVEITGEAWAEAVDRHAGARGRRQHHTQVGHVVLFADVRAAGDLGKTVADDHDGLPARNRVQGLGRAGQDLQERVAEPEHRRRLEGAGDAGVV
jgi:hypothetical protein